MKLLESVAAIFTKEYWVQDFPHEAHCFDCKKTDCSEKSCNEELERQKKRLIEEGMVPQE